MSDKILNFIKYNNAFTIIIVVCFLSVSLTFASSTTARENIYSSEEILVAVDNRLLLSTNLDNFNFNLRINSVTEDENNYFAQYSYQTLTIKDGIWQASEISKTLTIDKSSLGENDLGLYIAKELGENINYELASLGRVQKSERERGESQKIVAVDYSGLVGKLLDPKEMVIEGYTPVIPESFPMATEETEFIPDEVIVSVQHPEPKPTNENEPSKEISDGAANTTETPIKQNETETPEPSASPEPTLETETSPTPTATPEQAIEPDTESASSGTTTDEATSAMPELVNENLVQKVVEELLTQNVTDSPEESSASEVTPQTEE